MKLIKIPLAVAAVFSLGIAGIAPALADSRPPAPAHRPHIAKGQSAPGARTLGGAFPGERQPRRRTVPTERQQLRHW